MDDMTTEELARACEDSAEIVNTEGFAKLSLRVLKAAARLRATDAELAVLTYTQAKEAVRLYESEYIGQEQADLWAWAIDEARKG